MTAVLANGPVEFTNSSSGRQLSVPLKFISFDGTKMTAKEWPNYKDKDNDKVDDLLKDLYNTGIIRPAPQETRKSETVIKATNPESSGDNIQVTRKSQKSQT